MGDLIDSCITCRKNDEKKEKTDKPLNPSISSIGKVTVPTEGPGSSTKKIINQNNFIKVYYTSPYDKYEELGTLGKGAYGLVKKVCLINYPKVVRAMKIISNKNIIPEQSDNLIKEIQILGNLEAPNVMKIYEYYYYKENIYIISEFYNEGDLLGKIEKMDKMNEFVFKFLMMQILDAVKYLHEKGVFHGDIKLENIMISRKLVNRKTDIRMTQINKDFNKDNNLQIQLEINSKQNSEYLEGISYYEIKLIDFGCSKYLKRKKGKKVNKNNMLSGIVGTSAYCSPEVINNSYDEKSDEWSCGVLMYILLCHAMPFKGETEEEIFGNVKKYNVDFNIKEFNNISNECMDLMKKLLNPNKDARITAAEALKHSFFRQLDPKLILTRHKDLNILKKFFKIEKYQTILHKVVIAYCCYHLLDQEEEKNLNELFLYLDKKRRNKLSLNDFKEGFKEAKIPISDYEIKEILKILDTDGSKYIEYQEFLRAFCDKGSLLNDDNLKIVFDVIDKDKKGYANINDLKIFIMGNSKKNLKETTFNKFIGDIGMTKNSKLYFEQFCDIIRKPKTENIKIKRSNSFVFSTDTDSFLNKDEVESNKNKKRRGSVDCPKFKFK